MNNGESLPGNLFLAVTGLGNACVRECGPSPVKSMRFCGLVAKEFDTFGSFSFDSTGISRWGLELARPDLGFIEIGHAYGWRLVWKPESEVVSDHFISLQS